MMGVLRNRYSTYSLLNGYVWRSRLIFYWLFRHNQFIKNIVTHVSHSLLLNINQWTKSKNAFAAWPWALSLYNQKPSTCELKFRLIFLESRGSFAWWGQVINSRDLDLSARRMNQSPVGNIWSAVPLLSLSTLEWQCWSRQGSGPKGDNVL